MSNPHLYIIFFDTICTLCHRSVKVLIGLDKKQQLHYSSLQGDIIKSIVRDKSIDSIIFYDNGDIYYKSTAILKIF